MTDPSREPFENREQMAKEYDFLFKLLLIGDADVAKTSILVRYAEDNFNSTFISTIGELSCLVHCNLRCDLQLRKTFGFFTGNF